MCLFDKIFTIKVVNDQLKLVSLLIFGKINYPGMNVFPVSNCMYQTQQIGPKCVAFDAGVDIT